VTTNAASPKSSRLGRQTIAFRNRPALISAATVVGPVEAAGPLADDFDVRHHDSMFGQRSFEHAETFLLREAAELAIRKPGLTVDDIDLMFAGDLLNQLMPSSFAARHLYIPFVGLYGACSTMAESLALAAAFVDGGYAERALAVASSHFDSAERQYRYPTEFGAQRVPTSQRTVTGSGAAVVAREGHGPAITHATLGRVVDMGIKDSNDMGSAMAPAAAQTIMRHFSDLGVGPEHYDLIATGDLASVGKTIAVELMAAGGLDLGERYQDCGTLVYHPDQPKVAAGGSGCGCSAIVFCGHFLRRMLQGELRRMLLVCTGALLSPTSYQQGDTIPCIAHAVAVEAGPIRHAKAGGNEP
jgi:stage V sporulation protein AD